MRESTRNLLVGTFVVLALSVLGVLMVMFGEAPRWLRARDWQLAIGPIEAVQGLSPGSPVYLNGVEIGRVSGVELRNRLQPSQGVQVVAQIKDKYVVPASARAKIYGATLGLGTGRVEIIVDPGFEGGQVPMDDTALIAGESGDVLRELVSEDLTSSVERMIDNIGNLAHAATPVAENLGHLLEKRSVADVDNPFAGPDRVTANLSTAIERFDELVRNVNTVLGDEEVQQELQQVSGDLAASATRIRELVELWHTETARTAENLNQGIDHTDEQLQKTLASLLEVTDNLDQSTSDLARAMARVEAGEGTVGMFINDPRLYEAAVLSLERIARVAANLEVITGKIAREGYITVGQTTPVGTVTKDFPVEDFPPSP
jgi:phospholipid/cholesterol/gamma-HCH transport system substrate-binding protein